MRYLPIVRVAVALTCGALVSTVSIADATADQYKYIGGHPIAAGGFCHIEAPHVHVYKPGKSKKQTELLYRTHQGHYRFVGDPVGHGYDGPKYSYYGHHPVLVDASIGVHTDGGPSHVEFCYLNGPHYHWHAPTPGLTFELKGDAYWYTGVYPEEYESRKTVLVGINGVYKPMKYARPVVTVEPPVAYVGPIVDVHVGGPAVHGHVGGPVVHGHVEAGVEIHAPSIEVGIGVPGVVVVDEHHHHHKHKHKKFKRRKVIRKHFKRGRH